MANIPNIQIVKSEYSKDLYNRIKDNNLINKLISEAKSGNTKSRDKVFNSFVRMASKEAEAGFARQKPKTIPLDDFYQASMMGLLKAIETYNPEKGTKFSTHATYEIRGGNGINGMVQSDRLDIYIPHDAKYHKDNFKADKVANLYVNRINHDADEDTHSSYTWISSNFETPSESLERRDAMDKIRYAIDNFGLSDVERFGVYGTFRELHDDVESLDHVAEIFNISHEGARKAGLRGLEKLQGNKEFFKDFKELFYT